VLTAILKPFFIYIKINKIVLRHVSDFGIIIKIATNRFYMQATCEEYDECCKEYEISCSKISDVLA
jgi:hypothetical protein